MSRNDTKKERGFILLTVIVTITLVAAIALALGYQGARETSTASGELEQDRLRYITEAGMAHATHRLSQNTSCSGYASVPSTSFGGDSYSAAITPNDASPVSISATGTLSNGVQKTLTRNNVRVFSGTVTSATLQPGPEGEDTYIWDGAHKDTNFGATAIMELNNASAERVILMRFDLSSIPADADVSSATLELYLEGGSSLSNGVVDAHRVTQTWFEGEEDDNPPSAPGATYMDYDGTNAWASSGGDFDPVPVSTTIIPNLNQGWHQWDVSALAVGGSQSELAGNGVLLRASGGNVDKIKFTSGDGNAAEAPKLTVTYACECGQTCAEGAGSGNRLLFVVTDATSPVADEIERQTLVESWGYVVTRISDEDSQANFDAATSVNDLAYISGDALYNNVGIKLKAATIGVAFESYQLQDEFGMSPGSIALANQQSITIIDSSHYITSPFSGSVNVVTANTQLSSVSSYAPDTQMQLLASIPGYDGALATFDTGDVDHWGETVAGRRVKLPWGSTDWGFDFSTLSADGQNILKRSLEWIAGADAGGGGPKKVLFVVGDVGGPGMTTEELAHQALIESWGHTVGIIDDDAAQEQFDKAAANYDVAYITNDITASRLSTKLVTATIGVVSSEDNLSDEFGLSSSVDWESGTVVEINDNTHYITSPFSLGILTVFSGSESLAYLTGTVSADLGLLASSSSGYGVVTLDAAATMFGGGAAAGRRVQLPWGGSPSLEPNDLTADGLTILQRALEWGAGAGSATYAVLMVVTDPSSPTSAADARKTLLESWGYTVTLIDDNDSQANFDAGIAVTDVVYVGSGSVGATIGTKLDATTKGVVNEPVSMADTLGFASSWTVAVNVNQLTIVDSTHSITQGLANPVTVFTALESPAVLSGTLSPDLQNLAEAGAAPALAVLESGAAMHDAGATSGRRAQLPFAGAGPGELTADGELIVRRAIEWAAGSGGGGGTIDIQISDGSDDAEQLTSSGAMEVTSSDLELADNLSSSGQPSDIVGIRFPNVSIPQGESITYAHIQFQVDETDSGAASLTIEGEAVDDAAQFTTAAYDITSRPRTSASVSWTPSEWTTIGDRGPDQRTDDLSPIIQEIVGRPGWSSGNSLAFIISGSGTRTAEAYEGDAAGAAELHIKYGGGGGGGGGGSCDGTFRDEFNVRSYSENNGTLSWATDWLEIGESDGPTSGDEQIPTGTASDTLRVRDNDGGGEGVEREADLTGAASATLSFTYKRKDLDNASDYVTVDISSNGAAGPWTEVDRFEGPGSDSGHVPVSHDISPYISNDTRIRFLTSSTLGGRDELFFDNVEIACSP